jgi:hypothetical protein
MAALGTKVVVLMMVLPSLLLLLQTSSVYAVDILLYNDNGCSGTVADGCYSIGPDICCAFDGAGGVGAQLGILNLLFGQTATIFTGGGCTTAVTSNVGPSSDCYFNDALTGAIWNFTPLH